jgi:FtsZ-interacting cell division protein ZipA
MDETITYNIDLLEFTILVVAAILIVGVILKTIWDNDRKGPR